MRSPLQQDTGPRGVLALRYRCADSSSCAEVSFCTEPWHAESYRCAESSCAGSYLRQKFIYTPGSHAFPVGPFLPQFSTLLANYCLHCQQVAAGVMAACLPPGTGAARLMLFVGGPTTLGPGKVVDTDLLEPIRSHKVGVLFSMLHPAGMCKACCLAFGGDK